MSRAAVLLLLGLTSCAAPRRSEVSLRDSLGVVEGAPDPAGEFSLVVHLARPEFIHILGGPSWDTFDATGWERIIRNDWKPEVGPSKTRVPWVPQRDYGLYASPIE